MKLEVSVKNSALILADIIIYCPGYRLASAPNMNQANSQLGKQTKKDMSAGGSAETQRIKPAKQNKSATNHILSPKRDIWF